MKRYPEKRDQTQPGLGIGFDAVMRNRVQHNNMNMNPIKRKFNAYKAAKKKPVTLANPFKDSKDDST